MYFKAPIGSLFGRQPPCGDKPQPVASCMATPPVCRPAAKTSAAALSGKSGEIIKRPAAGSRKTDAVQAPSTAATRSVMTMAPQRVLTDRANAADCAGRPSSPALRHPKGPLASGVLSTDSKQSGRGSSSCGSSKNLVNVKDATRLPECGPQQSSSSSSTTAGEVGAARSASMPAAHAQPSCHGGIGMPAAASAAVDTGWADRCAPLASDGLGCSVVVAVRVRPFTQRELDGGHNTRCAITADGCDILVTNDAGQITSFTYDYAFSSFSRDTYNGNCSQFASQQAVYEALGRPLLAKAIEGYNVCLFAYGQTGSGKSFSIMGSKEDEGIIPRFSRDLFECLQANEAADQLSSSAEISFFEIYNEKIHDLLSTHKGIAGEKASLKVREHPQSGPYVEGLSSLIAKSYEDILMCLDLGNKQRATAATGMNDKSSRSHSVFTIVLSQRKRSAASADLDDHSIVSRINLVDLAGSERQSSAQTSGQRLKEGASINRSLLALGTVINLLAERTAAASGRLYIPYRDSSLTWLLKESLGGNSRTVMLATVSPASAHVDETLSTLRYASRARSIVNVARINEDPNARLIRELRAEIERLKLAQSEQRGGGDPDDSAEYATLADIAELKRALQDKEREVADMQRSWEDKLRQMGAASHILEESALLENTGIALKADSRLPCLINLNEDPQLSEVLSYVVKTGVSKVGRRRAGSKADIQLIGALIADEHCLLKNSGGVVTITSVAEAQTYINGDLITSERTLHHGDRVVIGGNHYFRFNYPSEAPATAAPGSRLQASLRAATDFAYAQSELLRVQNERMLAERERLKEDMRRQLDSALAANESTYASRLDQQRLLYEGTIRQLEKDLEMQNLAEKTAREQKLSLEREVLANRKRVRLQADQNDEETRKLRDDLVRKLAAEKERAEVSLRRIVEKREATARSRAACVAAASSAPDCAKPSPPAVPPDACRLSMLVREANQICTHLGKSLMFQVEDLPPSLFGTQQQHQPLTVVSVTNSTLAAITFWSLDKFEARLLDLREAFASAGDGGGTECDHVLDSACDHWQPLATIKGSPSIKEQFLSDVLGCEAEETSAEQQLLLSPGQWSVRCRRGPHNALYGHEATVAACEDVLRFALRKYKGHMGPTTVLDHVLLDCEMVTKATRTLVEFFVTSVHSAENTGMVATASPLPVQAIPADSAVIVSTGSVQLVAAIQALLSKVKLCSNLTCDTSWDTSDSAISAAESGMQTYIMELQESVAKVSANTILLLQGIRNGSADMVRTATADILDAAVVTCSNVGRLSLLTGTKLDSANAEQISAKLSEAAANGLVAHVTRSLDGVLLSLRGSQCSLKTVRQVRSKDQDVNPCEHLLQLLVDLLSCLKGLLVTPSDKAKETAVYSAGKQAAGEICIWQADDFQPAASAAVLDCWRGQERYGKWLGALSLVRGALGSLVKPLLRPGSGCDRNGMVGGAEIIHEAVNLLVEDLPSSPPVAPVHDLQRRIGLQIVALFPKNKVDAAMAQASSRLVVPSLSGAGAKRRASCLSVVTVSKLAAIFEK